MKKGKYQCSFRSSEGVEDGVSQDIARIDRIIRSDRRTIALVVTEEGELLVRAPWDVPEKILFDLVRSREGWIRRKQGEVLRNKPVPRRFEEGGSLPFLGRDYPISFTGKPGKGIELRNRFIISSPASDTREQLVGWYREQAKNIIPDRCEHWSVITGLKPGAVRITGARTRWGSCSSRGSLNFTWRLVMAPMDIVDYVVVHELVHLEIRNHSRNFWDRVGSILPDYRQRRKWLREQGGGLVLREGVL